jgi:hypothetical protein
MFVGLMPDYKVAAYLSQKVRYCRVKTYLPFSVFLHLHGMNHKGLLSTVKDIPRVSVPVSKSNDERVIVFQDIRKIDKSNYLVQIFLIFFSARVDF